MNCDLFFVVLVVGMNFVDWDMLWELVVKWDLG